MRSKTIFVTALLCFLINGCVQKTAQSSAQTANEQPTQLDAKQIPPESPSPTETPKEEETDTTELDKLEVGVSPYGQESLLTISC